MWSSGGFRKPVDPCAREGTDGRSGTYGGPLPGHRWKGDGRTGGWSGYRRAYARSIVSTVRPPSRSQTSVRMVT